MPEPPQRSASSIATSSRAASSQGLLAGWREGLGIVNLRGNATDDEFREAAAGVLGIQLPVKSCSTSESVTLRVLWAGPDEWFVTGAGGETDVLLDGLCGALAGQHHGVTDVSSGYAVLQLGGPAVREVLAQGCPIDLHPRVFGSGMCVGSHFFKTSVWIWQYDDAPTYELLVRRSFMSYVWLMLERSSQECGLVPRSFA